MFVCLYVCSKFSKMTDEARVRFHRADFNVIPGGKKLNPQNTEHHSGSLIMNSLLFVG